MAKVVLWAATPFGYGVQLIEGGKIIDEYTAGNSPFDSTERLWPAHPDAVEPDELRRMAEQTAREMADGADVDECEDLEAELLERFSC